MSKVRTYYRQENGSLIREDTGRKWQRDALEHAVEIEASGGSKIERERGKRIRRLHNRAIRRQEDREA